MVCSCDLIAWTQIESPSLHFAASVDPGLLSIPSQLAAVAVDDCPFPTTQPALVPDTLRSVRRARESGTVLQHDNSFCQG